MRLLSFKYRGGDNAHWISKNKMAATAVQWELCGANFRENIANLWVSCYNGNNDRSAIQKPYTYLVGIALRRSACHTIAASDKPPISTLRPRQNGRHFADDIFFCIFLNKNVWIPIRILMKFVSKGPINIIPALIQIMDWRRLGDKPLSEPVLVGLQTHICVTRPQWVNMLR